MFETVGVLRLPSLKVVGVKKRIGVFSVATGERRASDAVTCTKERVGVSWSEGFVRLTFGMRGWRVRIRTLE